MSSNSKVFFEITLFFEDGGNKKFRTDEWNETILKNRLEESGRKIIREERVELAI
jgi:hypothetical protein